MSMKITALVLLCGAGCAPAPGPYRCEIAGVGRYSSEFYLDCGMVQEEVDLAFEVLDSWNLVPRSKQKVYENVEILVHRSWCMAADDPQKCSTGDYSWWPYPHIQLGYQRKAMHHEMLHHWDVLHFQPGTSWHQGWDSNGYNDAEKLEFIPRLKKIWERWGYNPSIQP